MQLPVLFLYLLHSMPYSPTDLLLMMGSPQFSPPEMRDPDRLVPDLNPFVVDACLAAWHLGVCFVILVIGFNPFQLDTDQFCNLIYYMEEAQVAMQPGDLDDMAFGPTFGPTPPARDGVHAIFLAYDKEALYYALPTPLVKLIDGTPANSNLRPSPTDPRPTSLDSPQAFSRSTRRTASTSRAPPLSSRRRRTTAM
jgi:hypothetical protein